MIYDAIIIGGGPAGLMAANQFEKEHIHYLLLEKNEKCGKKLRLTGGKRCNVTNHLPIKMFIDTLTFKHKKFLYHALHTFSTQHVLSFFHDRGLDFVLENNFKYFPETEKSASVLEALLKEIDEKHIRYHQSVKTIQQTNNDYILTTKDQTYEAKHVIVATGSNSFPSTGSSGDGLKFAEHLGINYFPFTPAETHVYSKYVTENFKALQGVSLQQVLVKIKGTKHSYQNDLLFTHFGLSGPVIMHLSEFIDEDIRHHQQSILEFSFVSVSTEELFSDLIDHKHNHLRSVLLKYSSKKIVDVILNRLNIHSKKIIEISKKDLQKVCQTLTHFQVIIDKVEDKEKAYVNKGGIDTKALDPKSMAVKTMNNLYFVGEVTDLHGPIGGYNITIALSTGYLASNAILSKLKQP